MKTRIITGVIAALVLAVVLLLPPIVTVAATAVVAAIAVWEAVKATGIGNHNGQLIASMLVAAAAPFLLLQYKYGLTLTVLAVLAYIIAMAVMQVISHEKVRIETTGYTVMMTVLIAVVFTCVAKLRLDGVDPLASVATLQHGRYLIVVALFIPWLSDIGAYFTGVFFGKHKLCPKVSPKKTVEGLIGGLVFSPLLITGTLYVYQLHADVHVYSYSYWLLAGTALIGSVLSVFGDLFASVIKRQHGIKDFGNIFPGHGGILDRFDSFFFALPMVALILDYIPLFK
ncbi:MAG: phosphatidate cytidylyltransferase [Clostridia bacterium]|nr:phosphatidate cytidylyltransferase [Clostridia bacterium]